MHIFELQYYLLYYIIIYSIFIKFSFNIILLNNFISESSSEKYEEKISWFSNTANINKKTCDSSGIQIRTFWNTSVHHSTSWAIESLGTVCMRYSCDDLTLYLVHLKFD